MATDTTIAIRLALEGNQRVKAALRDVESQSDRLAQALRRIGHYGAAAFAFSGLNNSLSGLAQLADQVQAVNARLKLSTDGLREFVAAQQLAYRVAAQTGAGYEAVATLYTRLAQGARGFGLTQEQVARTTEATALALKVSGASAAEASSVIRQFSQALGAGALRGDEFNSIMENGGRLAQALADGLGLPIGRLRELAEQGLLTTDIITRALESQRQKLADEAARMPNTIGQSLSEVRDQFSRVVDEFNRATGATAGLASGFSALAQHMQTALGVAGVAAAGAMTAAIVRGAQAARTAIGEMLAKIAADRQAAISAQAVTAHEVAKAQAMLASANAAVAASSGMARLSVVQTQLVPAQQRLAAAQAAHNAAMAAGTGIARGLSAALGLVGGPLGLILTLLTAGATAWAIWGDRAKSSADKARDAIDAAREAAERLRKEERFGTGDAAIFRESIAALEQKERLLNESVAKAGSKAAAEELKRVRAELAARKDELAKIEAREKALGGPTVLGAELLGKQFDQYIDQYRKKLDPLSAALKELREQAAKAGIALNSDKFKQAEALVRKSFEKSETRLPSLADAFDAELARLKDGLKTAESVIEESFKGRLLTENQYWQARAETQRRALDLEERGLSDKLAAQQDLIRRLSGVKPKDANQQAEIAERLREARDKAAELQAQLDALNGRRVAVELAIQVDRARLDKELADIKARLAQEFAQATGTETPEMRLAAIRREYDDLLARFGDDPALRELVDKLVPVKAAQANLAALEAKWREAIERMRQAQDNANVLQQAGTLTSAQAQARIEAAAREAKGALEALLPDLEAAMQTLFPPDEVARRMETMRAEITKTQPVADSLMTKVAGQMQDAFANAFGDIVTGTKTVADAFRSMAQSILQSLARIFAQRAAEGIFKAVLKSFGVRKNAQGGVYTSESLARYANRIVSAPTLFTFATGGIPRLGLMGEAGPEAIMPLKRGPDGRLGVEAHGAGNVVVNVAVDASGSRVEGDAGSARQLGDMIAGAVRGILVAEKRPGGLLAGA
ncbi:tape measure protein [Sulfuritortus calidifontis]|nr:tape measure protein [Sulfuritortus calidifontis]